MQPWVSKGGSGSTTLSSDERLSYLHTNGQYTQEQPHSFRTAASSSKPAYSQPIEQEEQFHTQGHSNMLAEFATYRDTPTPTLFRHEDMADGTEVLEFLNSTGYSDLVHGDDLNADSISYLSHRHQLDTQHSLSEKEKLQKHWTAELLSAEDIVEYLLNGHYTEEIYGIPVLGQYIKEAKEELQDTTEHKKIAVERLTMIKNHLLQKHQNADSASTEIFKMNENDWSSFF